MLGKSKKALIIGADSLIGRNLTRQLMGAGWDVIGTTRKKEYVEKDKIIYLDLCHFQNFTFDQEVDVVFLCATVTAQAVCRENPEYTQLVNAEAQIFLTEYLFNKAKLIVFLSSAAVFDGSVPFRQESDKTCPLTLYGRQKVEVEEVLLKKTEKIAVVRLSKVLASDSALICNWIKNLSKGEIIEPFNDLHVCPISIDLVTYGLQKIAEQKLTGIIHLSGKEEVTYEYIAKYIAKKINFPAEHLVKPRSALSAGIAAEQVPPYASLGMQNDLFLGIEDQFKVHKILDNLYEVAL